MTCFSLKILALTTMLIDHIGAVFFPQYIWLRYIGRISFPIYAFLLSEGFIHTHSRTKYAARLFVFGIISEVPHDLAFYQKALDFSNLNIMFELYLGVLALSAVEILMDRKNKIYVHIISSVMLAVILFVSSYFNTSYGIYGIVLIISYYVFKGDRRYQAVSGAAVTIGFNSFQKVSLGINGFSGSPMRIFNFNPLQSYAAVASIPILLYNGERGYQCQSKWFFYAFYPAHLLVLYLIKLIIV